ncbi:hypothetical protein [Demequina zhanjiangensis]|uniref:Uncharacterized protein n=1 Tax=Demequina zhanjiangensis TaxID=3051659 RepID=A0ABT8G0N5_9MICO|nr:hypothetical protein [Demequina sp. SYSU T00b26]MDN4472709.1 hypothetical protein [Demequina sp. SYSU T00b26]
MTDTAAPLCPSHPYGYHRAARVNPAGARHVLRHHSLIGLPKRCMVLEEELLEADRELDFQEELTILERTPAPVWGVLVPFAVAVAFALLMTVESAAIAVPIAAIVALAIERIGAAVQRERLRRVVDWRRRVGR